MTYILIHTQQQAINNEIIKLVNKYLDKEISQYDEIFSNPDIHIIQADEESSVKKIKIEQCKKLQKEIQYSPFENKYQFGIILNSQLMTQEAQNSILKTLEETNNNTILILTTHNEKAVLETILSRCIKIYPKTQEEEKNTNFSAQEDFLELPLHEKIKFIDKILLEKKHSEFLDGLTRYFQFKYELKIKEGKSLKEELEILKILKEGKDRIERYTNKRITLEYICFKIN